MPTRLSFTTLQLRSKPYLSVLSHLRWRFDSYQSFEYESVSVGFILVQVRYSSESSADSIVTCANGLATVEKMQHVPSECGRPIGPDST